MMTNLQPGRELDALIAEKIMGLGDQHCVRMLPDGTTERTGEIWHECPYYSTDRTDALDVAQKLGITITSLPSGRAWIAFKPLIKVHADGRWDITHNADCPFWIDHRLAYAICYVALASLTI